MGKFPVNSLELCPNFGTKSDSKNTRDPVSQWIQRKEIKKSPQIAVICWANVGVLFAISLAQRWQMIDTVSSSFCSSVGTITLTDYNYLVNFHSVWHTGGPTALKPQANCTGNKSFVKRLNLQHNWFTFLKSYVVFFKPKFIMDMKWVKRGYIGEEIDREQMWKCPGKGKEEKHHRVQTSLTFTTYFCLIFTKI